MFLNKATLHIAAYKEDMGNFFLYLRLSQREVNIRYIGNLTNYEIKNIVQTKFNLLFN
jgi:hypothetical protein